MAVSNSHLLGAILTICALGVMLYTALIITKEADGDVGLNEKIKNLLTPIPNLPEITVNKGAQPLTLNLKSILGDDASLKNIQNQNEKISINIEDSKLTLSFDPTYSGSSELEFIINSKKLRDPIVKNMKVDVKETNQTRADFFSRSSVFDDPVDLPHECLPPYFPEEPLDLKKLKICHPDWIDSQTFFSKCENDPSCKRCIKDHQIRKADTLKKAISDNREQLRNAVVSLFTEKGIEEGGTVLLTMLNWGYFYHWSNWACSADKHNIPIRNYTLVVVFDDESQRRATEAGFMVYQPKWIPVKVDDKAASSFALGPHGVIMVFEHMMRNELVQMGYNVMFQDTDIIWKKDPMPWLQNTHPRLDIQIMYDGRTDGVGPVNSGFIFTRSNCRTKIYLQTMIDNIVFFLWDRASQPFVNALMHHRKFRQISMRLLDVELFMNGNRWTPVKAPDDWEKQETKDKVYVMHASWTGNHLDKINKWSVAGEWHLNPTCSLWDPGMFTDKVCKRLLNQTGIDCKAPKQDPTDRL